jgi:NAD(P)-dependent dehydrogenase (short-subunit alcohol dehydrogenase family)
MQPRRRVLITGARRGIGLADLAATFDARVLEADLADRTSTLHLVAALEADPDPIHVLVNNAGIAESAPIARTTDEMWDRTMHVNVTAPFLIARALVPRMSKAGFGRIVNVASNAGRSGYAYTSAYCASKHALVGLTRAFAAELAKTGVTVNAVCPGWVDTDMTEDAVKRIADKTKRTREDALASLTSMSPQGRLIQPDEVAALCLMLASDEARGIHGQSIVVDGGQVMA